MPKQSEPLPCTPKTTTGTVAGSARTRAWTGANDTLVFRVIPGDLMDRLTLPKPRNPCSRLGLLLFLQQLFPLRVHKTEFGLVCSFIGMRAEKVSLCLSEIEWEIGGTVHVEVSQTR